MEKFVLAEPVGSCNKRLAHALHASFAREKFYAHEAYLHGVKRVTVLHRINGQSLEFMHRRQVLQQRGSNVHQAYLHEFNSLSSIHRMTVPAFISEGRTAAYIVQILSIIFLARLQEHTCARFKIHSWSKEVEGRSA